MEISTTGKISDADLRESKRALKAIAYKFLFKKNDPYEFIKYEWPDLVITDKEELKEFKKYCQRKDWLDIRLDDFQVDIIKSCFDRKHSQIFVSGGTKLGKGFTVGGIVVNVWFSLYKESKIVLIGPDVEHVKRNLFAETLTWRRRMTSFKDETEPVECLTERLTDPGSEQHFVIIANPKTGEGLSGIHSPHPLFCFDEGCLDDQTEVLTRNGWKKFPDVTTADEIMTMNPETRAGFWEKPSHVHKYPWDGDLVYVEERGVSVAMTPSHRMPFYFHNQKNKTSRYGGFMRADSIDVAGSNKSTPACFTYDADDIEFYKLPPFKSERINAPEMLVKMDDWLEILGWMASEGSFAKVKGVKYGVVISQKKQDNLERIKNCLRRLGFNFCQTDTGVSSKALVVSSRRLAEHVFSLIGDGAINKRAPKFVFDLSIRQKKIFLDAFLLGDGYIKNNSRVYYTSSRLLADDIQTIALMTGSRVTKKSRGGIGIQSKIGERTVTTKHECFVVTESAKSEVRWHHRNPVRKHYSGYVYCLTMPSHELFFTRRNGLCVWSGNSGQPDTRYTDSLSQCSSGLFVCIGNPRQPSGFFYRAFKRFDSGCKTVKSEAGPRRLVSIGLSDCINVRADRVTGIVSPPGGITVDGVEIPEGEVIPENIRHKTRVLIPGQGCRFVCETLKRTVPADEIEWRVFGRFPKEARAFNLFQESWWDAATERHNQIKEIIEYHALGIDVAASEQGDYCSLAWGDSKGCKEIDLIRDPNTVMLKGQIYHIANQKGIELKGGYIPVGIDIGNMGSVLADMMELDGCFVVRVGGQAGADNKEIYVNKRAEMYGDLAGAVNPQITHKAVWALPDDDMLHEELMSLERIFAPDGKRFKLNSKRKLDAAQKQRNQNNVDSVEEKIGRSPDRADSVGYLYQAVKNLPDYFDDVAEQFDPSKYIRDFKEIGGGEVLVTHWDGSLSKMDKASFHQKFGQEPKKLEF